MVTTDVAVIDWENVKPGDACPNPPDVQIEVYCPFRWPELSADGLRKTIWECTRPKHAEGQHVAEGHEKVEAVHPW